MVTTYPDLFRTFGRIGLLSFGGPAGQIALMHRVLVDEKRWLDEARYLHALSFCMLLPGPEAMQLATYAGWTLKGWRGGLIAGLLFVLPGALVITALTALFLAWGQVPLVAGLLFGLKAAVLAVVIEALLRVAKRALKGQAAFAIAIAAFAAIAFMKAPFPLVIAAAALAGALFLDGGKAKDEALADSGGGWREALASTAVWGALWLLPLAALLWFSGVPKVLADEALFFSKMAVVTFGGAYAVLAYVAQQAVDVYGWLSPGEMLTGLGLAETTPGPLILVLVFVGFLGGARLSGWGEITGGLAGAGVTLWFTFVPCFLWVLAGAPFVERLRRVIWLTSALAGVTAAVVGVIANLALWFGLHALFGSVGEAAFGPLTLPVPELAMFDWRAGLIAAGAGVALLRLRWNLFAVLGLAAAAGAAVARL
ncbi:MAG: chromate efflux transporter [Phyllobacteriaceae bacterium]|nr:chromate efflux transporter [Phyllobacteriaceae bacterium]